MEAGCWWAAALASSGELWSGPWKGEAMRQSSLAGILHEINCVTDKKQERSFCEASIIRGLCICCLASFSCTVAEHCFAPLLGQTNMYGLAKAGAKIKADQPQVLQPIKPWLLCRVWATNNWRHVALMGCMQGILLRHLHKVT